MWQHLQQHGEHSLPAGQGWTRGQGLENQTKGSSGWCQEPAEGKDRCRKRAQSWGQSCSRGERRGFCPWHHSVLSGLVFQWSVQLHEVMETQSLTCLHSPLRKAPGVPKTPNSQQTRKFWPPWRYPPPKSSRPRALVRAGRRKHPFPSSPIQQNSLEQAGNITHAGNKVVVVSWALGERGGVSFFK